MAGTEIDVATLTAAANDCREAKDAVRQEQSNVRMAKENVGARWKGQASTTFQNVMQLWLDDADKLLAALNDISDLLDKTGSTHSANEDQQNSMFNQFNSAINR
jgi:WXG100 family type VII secretion target